VGYSDTASGAYHAFVSDGSQMVDLGTLGGAGSSATGINGAGHIVGVSDTADGGWAPFLYVNGTMHNLNDLVTGFSELISTPLLSESGQIAGVGLVNGEVHIYLLTWVADDMIQAAAPSAATALAVSSQTTLKAEPRTVHGNARRSAMPLPPPMLTAPGLKCPLPYCVAGAKKK
jgi:probable HAF family extracellular repeat protein